MVDINLIGDDQSGEEKNSEEEERVDDFTQTSSMDTQELAFEERTETFDTTKTYTHQRSYSSLISAGIIVGVIAILGVAIYFFMFKEDSSTQQADLPQFIPESESVVETVPDETESQPATPETEPETQPQPPLTVDEPETPSSDVAEIEDVTPSPEPPRTETRESFQPVTGPFSFNSATTLQTVTDVLTSTPSNLNATLLSYAGQRIRLEIVGSSASDARNFAASLNQTLGGGNFSVVSESQVATNGRSMEKVLISGSIVRGGSQSGSAQFLSLGQMKDWFQKTSKQFGLQVRQIKSQEGLFTDGYTKVPMLVRIYGDKTSLVGLLEAMARDQLNVEVTKVLIVSPDMISYSDEELMLVMNLFLYRAS
ncbi:hypothetical protein GWO43_28190 [candidate division KSB1 bacterium]|nr:hypothetical protein [candidate division KSB1 bacterium]NIR71351.1 hypothetical protein [candidate division KSB1 bacterium]NIS26241.1 hypothetical protein [candidate division KSB1 bacterium]NIT74671.1 hypothetical protein [candidate division KSB1 bacterium]NIU26889.1 hypothetical protein [candidate division KSB1 bacterium]